MKKNLTLLGLALILGLTLLPIEASAESASTVVSLNEYTNQYENYALGYSLHVYQDMKIDESAMDIRTRFVNADTTIDVYYDDFTNELDSFATYKNYGNKSLYNNPLFSVSKSRDIKVSGIKSHLIYYTRPKLSKIKNDKNYYACVEIPRTNKKVYTIIMKSSKPISDFEAIASTFKFTSSNSAMPAYKATKTITRPMSKEAKEFYDETFAQKSNLKFGIFEPTAPYDFSYLKQLQTKLDYDFPVIVRYQHMDEKFPKNEMLTARLNNKVVELTMQTTKEQGSQEDITYKILNGEYDQYFITYANDLKSINYPVLFRLNNEMNGDWCKYSAYHYGKDADLYVELYRYIYDLFKANGVDNAIFVWNPNERSFPNFAWNHYMSYYPGDEYVDVVGLTGYNTGNYYKGESWRSFERIYDEIYYEYANRFSQPLMITEFGSSSHGGDKPAWIQDMFTKIHKYDRIKLAVWWSGVDWDTKGNPARIYKIDESASVIEAVKNGLTRIKK